MKNKFWVGQRCDGVSRRDFLHLGMLSCLGLSLADVLRLSAAESRAKTSSTAKSCILIWLDGGPSHLETFDPKPDAPSEIRGEFKPISTSVDGIQICEHLPRVAQCFDQIALIRSLTHELGNHDTGTRYLLTGHRPNPALDHPSLGSILAHETRSTSGMPPYVAIPSDLVGGNSGAARAGYLPGAFSPFNLGGDPSRPDYKVRDLNPPEGIRFDRIDRRQQMQHTLDQFSRRVEQDPAIGTRDAFFEQAYQLMTSPDAKAAFDLSKEPEKSRDRYGRSRIGTGCLLARRLVEAGSRFITVVDTGWDTHQQIFKALPDAFFPGSGKLPALDRAYSSLIIDLKERGLLDSTLVLLMGEFGRTPKLNSVGGRDHWPRAGSICFAGGGVRGGQVIGATDAYGESPIDTPIRPEDVAFSILKLLGVDPEKELRGPGDRPLKIMSDGAFISQLI